MPFDARKIADSMSAEPFVFTGLDGEEYELPNINTLTGEQGKRFRQGDESVLEEVADPEVVAAIDAMPLGVQSELSRAWVKFGESGKAASRSSAPRRPRRPSRST